MDGTVKRHWKKKDHYFNPTTRECIHPVLLVVVSMSRINKKVSPIASTTIMCAMHFLAATSRALQTSALTPTSWGRVNQVNRMLCGSMSTCRSLSLPQQELLFNEPLCLRARSQLFHSNSKHNSNESSLQENTTSGDTPSSFTVRQAYTSSLKQLQDHGVSEPDWSVAHLLSNALDLPWSDGFVQLQRSMENLSSNNKLSEKVLTQSQLLLYQSMVERRLQNEPLQYILGKWDFLDYEGLVIRAPLLCPRPETEELIELVRKDIQLLQQSSINDKSDNHQDAQPINVLDVGCGTGVIGISLADKNNSSNICAIDIEPIAVTTALENAEQILGPDFAERYSVVECSAGDYKTPNGDGFFDVIVSNPPYIPRDDMGTLSSDVIEYESDQALCGGDDGMDVIRIIIHKWALEWGKPLTSTCWMEVDPSHPALLQSWLDEEEQRKSLGVFLESTFQDMSGNDRFVKLAFR